MACEILTCCQFFNDKMQEMPKTAAYIKEKLCLDAPEACGRFRIFKEFGGENIPFDLHPDDIEEVKKVMQCLRSKRLSEGA